MRSTLGRPTVPGQGLFLGLLGPLAAWLDGQPLDLGTPQQRRLLALLVVHRNDLVSTDSLVDSLWPHAPPRNAVQVVRTYVSRLRRLLAASVDAELRSEAGGYRLLVVADSIDVETFEALAFSARRELDHGDASRAEAELEAALALFRGPPLAGIDDEFARYEAERLDELRLLVAEDLFDARLAQGRHEETVPHLRNTVAHHPLRERLWAQLMLALYRSGRQAEALEAYREARRVLDERLGLEPSTELRALERMILLQERTLDHDAVGRLHGFPRYNTSFIGRVAEVEAVRDLLRRDRLVMLAGPAGVGKSRLAAEAASRLRSSFPDGLWWVDLSVVEPDDVATALGDGLGVRGRSGQDPAALVAARLRGARTLVVLDNCDRVGPSLSPLVSQVLDQTESARFLATSREPLRLAGERVRRVAPLATPPADVDAQDRVIEFEAVRLLMARAGRVSGGVRLDDETAPALALIVRRLDGLPLAIELAAGKLAALSLAELARSLDERLDLLADGDRAAPPRQQTLEDTIAWSYELLKSHERRVFERLGVFPGTFDTAAAEAVCCGAGIDRANVLPVLVRLVEKSLLTAHVEGASRYRMLTTVRTFALARAEQAGGRESARARHRDHYIGVAEQLFGRLIGSDLGAALAQARADDENVRAALRFALESGDGDAALQLASALAVYWFRTSRLREGRELLIRALELSGPESRWRPRALLGLVWLALSEGSPDVATLARRAVDACSGADDELKGFAFAALARAELQAGQLDAADRAVRQAGRVFARLDHAEGLALTALLVGVVCSRRGDLDGAHIHLVRARDRYRAFREAVDAGWTLVELARVELAAGRLENAHAAAADAVEDFRSRDDPRGLAAAFLVLGQALAASGDLDRAQLLFAEALELAGHWEFEPERRDAALALSMLEAPPATAPPLV